MIKITIKNKKIAKEILLKYTAVISVTASTHGSDLKDVKVINIKFLVIKQYGWKQRKLV